MASRCDARSPDRTAQLARNAGATRGWRGQGARRRPLRRRNSDGGAAPRSIGPFQHRAGPDRHAGCRRRPGRAGRGLGDDAPKCAQAGGSAGHRDGESQGRGQQPPADHAGPRDPLERAGGGRRSGRHARAGGSRRRAGSRQLRDRVLPHRFRRREAGCDDADIPDDRPQSPDRRPRGRRPGAGGVPDRRRLSDPVGDARPDRAPRHHASLGRGPPDRA